MLQEIFVRLGAFTFCDSCGGIVRCVLILQIMSEQADQARVIIQRSDILSPPAQTLIEALNAELSGRYPEQGACHFRSTRTKWPMVREPS